MKRLFVAALIAPVFTVCAMPIGLRMAMRGIAVRIEVDGQSEASETCTGLYTRTPNGYYHISSTAALEIKGDGLDEALLCVPYPTSNIYQDVIWDESVTQDALETYPETGEHYICSTAGSGFNGVLSTRREFDVLFYKVEVDFSRIGELYTYDTTQDVFRRYVRQPEPDGNGNLWVDTTNEWVLANSQRIMSDSSNCLEYVRAVYLLVSTNFSYSTGWQKTISDIVASKKGDCGQLSSVFVSLLRAGGIPARIVACIRPDATYHVWSEFYLERYGWIPVDVSYEVENHTRFERFGVYDDKCVIMTHDTHLTPVTKSGREATVCLVQNYAYWYWCQSATEVEPSFTFTGSVLSFADPIPVISESVEIGSALSGSTDGRLASCLKTIAEYNSYRSWAYCARGPDGSFVGAAAVKASPHAWSSYIVGASGLMENEPTIELGGLEVADSASGAKEMTVAVTVKDGERAVAVDQEKVAAMFEATGDLGDWTGAAKLTPTVTPSGTDASGKMTFVVIPGDGTAAKAFLRIRK